MIDDRILPIEIRPGEHVRVFGLPLDLTKREADKIAAVIEAMAAPPKDRKSERTAP